MAVRILPQLAVALSTLAVATALPALAQAPPAASGSPTDRLKRDLAVWPITPPATDAVNADLAAGADPDLGGKSGYTVLHIYCDIGDAAEVKHLLAVGVKPIPADLMVAADDGHDDIIAELEAAGLDLPDASGHPLGLLKDDHKALSKALVAVFTDNPMNPDLSPRFDPNADAYLLLHMGADPNTRDQYGESVFRLADGYLDNKVLFQAFLAAGVDVNERGAGGMTELENASGREDVRIVGWLLAAGANPNEADDKGATPLHCASGMGTACAALLLAHGADPNKADKEGLTPALEAARQDYEPMAEFLVLHGANVNAQFADTYFGYTDTLLREAVSRRNAQMVRFLVAHGADVNLKTADGMSMRAFARREDPEDKSGIDTYLRKPAKR